MANIYQVVRAVENITELEKEVSARLNEGWKLAGGITVALAIGADNGDPVPTLVYLQAMTREE